MTLTNVELIVRDPGTEELRAFGFAPAVRTRATTDAGLLAAAMDAVESLPEGEGLVTLGARFVENGRLRVVSFE